jgi:hypothetical protein
MIIVGLLMRREKYASIQIGMMIKLSVQTTVLMLLAALFLLLSFIASQISGNLRLIFSVIVITTTIFLLMFYRLKLIAFLNQLVGKKRNRKLFSSVPPSDNSGISGEFIIDINLDNQKIARLKNQLYTNPYVTSIELSQSVDNSTSSFSKKFALQVRYLKHETALDKIQSCIKKYQNDN